MTQETRSRRRARGLLLIPIFAGLFWVTALIASSIPGLLVLGVNVHALSVASYAGDAGVPLAPLSQQIFNDVSRDGGNPPVVASGAASPTPSVSAPGPTAQATAPATPSATPSPTGMPLPLPSIGPVPTPTAIPTLPPLPTPTSMPTPTPSPTPTPTPAPTVAKAVIAGLVTDMVTQVPIAAATVTLAPGGLTRTTDVNGNFSFDVDPTTYTVTVNAAAYATQTQTVMVASGQRLSLSFTMPYSAARGSVVGSVKDRRTGAPLAGATVQLSGAPSTTTDVTGSFTFPAVYPGWATLAVSHAGYVTQSQSVKVMQWQVATVQVSLVAG